MMQWFAVHTKPAREAAAAVHLARQGYPVYLPRCRRLVRHARRCDNVLRPLFQRYLFVGIDRARMAWRPILSTFGVAALVCGGGEPLPVPAAVIENLQERERSGCFDETALGRPKLGDAVRVNDGPFASFIGRLIDVRDDERVSVLLDFLGRIVRAEIPAASIEAA